MTPGLDIGIGIGFIVLIFFILGWGGHAPQNEKNENSSPNANANAKAWSHLNLDDTRLCFIYFLDDATRFAVASSILKLQPETCR